MATAILSSNNLDFQNTNISQVKMTAYASALAFSGVSSANVSVSGLDAVTALSFTDGFATLSNGELSGLAALSATTFTADTISDGVATLTGGNLTTTGNASVNNLEASGNVSAVNLTASGNVSAADVVATGDVSAVNFTASGDIDATGDLSITNVTAVNITASGTITTSVVTGLAAPSHTSDATNKAYVDSIANGLYWKSPVRAVSLSNINLQSSSVLADGVTLIEGDRVLLAGQTDPLENGIYTVQSDLSKIRAVDFAVGFTAASSAFFVQEGTAYEDTSFVCTNNKNGDVVGTDALVFAQFSAAGMLVPGDGLSREGNTLHVNVDDSTLQITGDILLIKDAGVTNAKLAESDVTVTAGDGLQNGGVVSLGGSITLDVDSTVFRTSGNQTAAGVKTFSDTTNATDVLTGAVVITGGLGVGSDIYCDNLHATNLHALYTISTVDVTASGNLAVVDVNATGDVSAVNVSAVGVVATGDIAGVNLTASGNLAVVDVNATGDVNVVNVNATGDISGDNISALSFTDGTASLSGGALTGVLSVVASTITVGTTTITNGVVAGLDAPSQASHAANKSYVDAVANGLYWKQSVSAATTTAGTLSSSYQNLETIDGVVLATGDRILLKNQTSAVENGIWVVSGSGAPTRPVDFLTASNAGSVAVFVQKGTVNGDMAFVCTSDTPDDVVDTNALSFTQFTGAGQLIAGAALSQTGNQLDVVVDDSTIEVSGDALRVKASGIQTSHIADNAITTAKIANNAITTAKITDANITNVKLANSSVTVTAGDGMTSGGSVALGSSVTLAVNSTVVRTTGAQSIAGIKTFSDATDATSTSTGAIVVSGGIGVTKAVFAGGEISALAFNATSDEREKQDICDIDSSDLDHLLEIRPVAYKFREGDGRKRFGVLAQDLLSHDLSSIVHENSTGTLSVEYNSLISLLLNKVQNMHQELESLKAKISFI